MQALGFNAIRMPFSMKDLWGLKPRVFNWECAAVSPQTFVKSVTDPAVPYASSAILFSFMLKMHACAADFDVVSMLQYSTHEIHKL